ncbi:[FeFe] hydrogenase H-cluster maturation GTPase HydF [Natranaerovirga pectinivora]|uniref:[FeFe] hydrogenase H-cluster maturation GTPase HydF n=1 Tax=Natranaerovirga pectinivora TaxID=682400 RepID=A0A4R3MNA2_9FIRM|nr:[FeFe] hydrogenase H-cluster maturation GTPase HydF [Natranaerovirga pectinivora]TCT16707.1 [FeFe] hydrogenase H-cluster maturation GTPase HydF [Natranaerovirga pectinivora]
MNLDNNTTRSNRLHIALFGKTNSGKSSIINAITGQNISLVSEINGTTTDPVYKSMELLPLGPVVIIDTAGLNDSTPLGHLRKEKTLEVLNKTDIALIVIDPVEGADVFEKELIAMIKEKNLPFVCIINKMDLISDPSIVYDLESLLNVALIKASAKTLYGINEIKESIIKAVPSDMDITILDNLVSPKDIVVLVIPIDSAAPKGRIILPQQQVLREVLDKGGICLVCQDNELEETLMSLNKNPKIIITDSQVFDKVSKIVPDGVMLTSFSILFAKYKGDLKELVKGAQWIENLKEGDRVLISEGCTHHRQKDDIGTVKIPNWLKKYTGKNIIIDFTSGYEYPKNLSDYALIIHCGSCMLNRKEVLYRIHKAKESNVPIVNYGVFIAYVNGILNKTLEPFIPSN